MNENGMRMECIVLWYNDNIKGTIAARCVYTGVPMRAKPPVGPHAM